MARRWIVLVVVCGCGAVGAVAGIALAVSRDGGSDIASAPELPVGLQVQGGGDSPGCGTENYKYSEFWRVTLGRADHLRLDYGSTNGNVVYVDLLSPAVTDYTLHQSNALTSRGTTSKDELGYIASSPGRYTIWLNDGSTCESLAYILTGYVQHYTSVQATAPPTVTQGSKVTYYGSVAGVTSGQLVLYGARGGSWVKVAVLPIASNGSFRYTTRAGSIGTFRLRFSYIGDSQHLPSSATKTIRVV